MHVYKSVACERSFKSSCWLNPVRIPLASEPKGGCPQRSASLLGWLPWLSAENRNVENGLWPRTNANGVVRIPAWHPEELIPIQSAITYSLRTQFQSNPRLSFSYCLPYLCTNYLWPQDIQRPDTSCYPQQTLISRNHNPSSVLLMLHPSWSACRHYCQSSSVFVPSPSPRAVHIMYLQFKKISQSFTSYLQ